MKKLIKICMPIIALLTLFMVLTVSSEAAEGEEAYTYLQEIDKNFSYRISDFTKSPDNSSKVNFGNWIKSKLQSFGYQPFEVGFIHSNGTPVTDIVARKQGRNNKRIVIGAHYDSVDTKGVEDNGTGVSTLLELAHQLFAVETECTIDFCFWDGEETLGFAGSYVYMLQCNDGNIICNINVDCDGAGDRLYAASGEYENGTLQRVWPLNMAADWAIQNNIDLNVIPEGIQDYETPTMTDHSDHYFFNVNGIPYIYFLTAAWVNDKGEVANPEHPHLYTSALPAFQSTNGQIIHKKEFEDLATLESLTGNALKTHMQDTIRIVYYMLKTMTADSSNQYAGSLWEQLKNKPNTETETEKQSETVIENEMTEDTLELTNGAIDESDKSANIESETMNMEKRVLYSRIIGGIIIGANLILLIVSIYKIIHLSRKKRRR